jgi:hypothetical protein
MYSCNVKLGLTCFRLACAIFTLCLGLLERVCESAVDDVWSVLPNVGHVLCGMPTVQEIVFIPGLRRQKHQNEGSVECLESVVKCQDVW